MKLRSRNKICVLILGALFVNLLGGCHANDPVEVPVLPEASVRPEGRQRVDESEPLEVLSEEPAPAPEPTPEPELWDPEHRLDIDFTPAKGLELPVSGATGYVTVKLPLWEELPQEDEGKLATIYAPPEPTPVPSAEPSPEPSLEPAPEPPEDTASLPEETPAGTEPAEDELPPQADDAGTAPDEPEASPEEPESGGQDTSITEKPAAEPTSDFTPEPAAESTPGFAPEPTPESTPEADPEPVPDLTPEPTAEPTPEPIPEPTPAPDPMEGALAVLEPGTAFTVLEEAGDWWRVLVMEKTGWVEHRYCLINLPDVVPSIVYDAASAYSAVFVSSGKTIPNVTGKVLYHGKEDNPRLGYKEFMMPVLYSMAKNVCQAQQNALAEGNTIVLYEGYRPYDTQMEVVSNLSALAQTDGEVKAGISTAPWNISWFIATGSSNHQEGYAVDVSLAKVTKAHVGSIAGYSVVQVDEYEEYDMPTPIHELSMAAAAYTTPVAIFSTTAWRSAEMTPAMEANEPAKALQRYCTEAKLTPMASKWWHFNDLTAYSQIRVYHSSGEFEITTCLSTAPG